MTISKEKIKEILNNIQDGDQILNYIEELEDEKKHQHQHHHECCDCGCEDEEQEWEEIDTGYTSNLSVSDWEKLLKDETVFNKDSLIVLKRMRHIAAPTGSAELADLFGYGALFYSFEMDKLETRIAEKLDIHDIHELDKWAILFNGWQQKNSSDRIFALLPELYEAIGNVDLSQIPLREQDTIKES